MKRLFIALALGIAVGFSFLRWTAQHAFPTEDEIKNKIHAHMTREEVVQALGDPNGEHRVDARTMEARYLPALALLDKMEPGYIGFVVTFEDGVVRDWRVLTGEPSYAPNAGARAFKWWLILWPSLFVALLIIGRIRAIPVAINERADMLQAFTAMKIPPRLPADFAFITHDTSLRELLQRVGPCSRELNFAVRPDEVSNYPLIETKSGAQAIRTLVYDLPDSDSLMVMPEYPFEETSVIRAVYRWRGGAGAAD
jgi:hypothetical protein